MRRKRRARENPKGTDTTTVVLWIGMIGALVGVAYGLKYMSDAQRKSTIGV